MLVESPLEPVSLGASEPGPSAADGQPDASPLRILVAEDNPTNQLVARAMLEKFGHHVDIVEDGTAAIAAVCSAPYDLVLMDVMMPRTDGLAATRVIRGLPRPEAGIYIVAVTGNAFEGDGERCRAAGMNDFLTKPITRGRLAATLDRFRDRAAPVPGGEASVEVADADPPFDRDRLERLVADLGVDTARTAIDLFLQETMERVASLGNCSRDESERELHSLKSSALTVGLTRVSRIARSMERTAHACGDEDYRHMIAELDSALREGAEWLRATATETCRATAPVA